MRESKMCCFRPCRPSVYLIVATNQSINIWLGQVILNSRVYRSSASWADIDEPVNLNIRHLIGRGRNVDQSDVWDLVHILDNDLDRTDQVQNYAGKLHNGLVTNDWLSAPTVDKWPLCQLCRSGVPWRIKELSQIFCMAYRLGTQDLRWHSQPAICFICATLHIKTWFSCFKHVFYMIFFYFFSSVDHSCVNRAFLCWTSQVPSHYFYNDTKNHLW